MSESLLIGILLLLIAQSIVTTNKLTKIETLMSGICKKLENMITNFMTKKER